MKDNADSDAGPYHSQNKRKHIKKPQGIVTPLNRVFDYAFLRRQPGVREAGGWFWRKGGRDVGKG